MFKLIVLFSLVCATYGQVNKNPRNVGAHIGTEPGNHNPGLLTFNSQLCTNPTFPNYCNSSTHGYCCPSAGTVCCGDMMCCTADFPVCTEGGFCEAGGPKLGANILYIVALAIFLVGKEKIGLFKNEM